MPYQFQQLALRDVEGLGGPLIAGAVGLAFMFVLAIVFGLGLIVLTPVFGAITERLSGAGAVFLWAYTGILLNHTSKSGYAGAYPGVIAMAAICLAAFAAVFVTLLVAPGLRAQRKSE